MLSPESQSAKERDCFLAALELADPSDRTDYLDMICGDDREMRERLDHLLNLNDDASAFMSAEDCISVVSRETGAGEIAGMQIGNYVLVEVLGEGAFGSVWRAEQKRPVRRQVALKILKMGMDTREVLARFEQESQALAKMSHPNIAKVLDAGATPSGRPFFAMELVENGKSITDFCHENGIGVRERIALFRTVCKTVQHAHRKGIIHRDLKPSNVLVSGDPQREVKVIDFGIAKAMEDKSLTDLTIKTMVNSPMGTPAYMSPEQFRGAESIDTRTDVYSLGVLLYELLTGATPFVDQKGKSDSYEDLKEVVCHHIPKKPSTRIKADMTRRDSKVASELSGDLDCITLKALEAEPDRRYESPAALADDLERYLKQEPIFARAHSKAYRTKLFVRRYRGAVITATVVLLALVVGLTVSSVALVREKAAREMADREVLRSRKVSEILNNTLLSAGVSHSLGRDATMMKEILNKTAGEIAKETDLPPDIEAEIQMTLGRTFEDLDDYENSFVHIARSVELRRLLLNQDGEQGKILLAEALYELAENEQSLGDMKASEALARESLEIFQTCEWEDEYARKVKIAQVEGLIGWTMFRTGRGKEAEAMARKGYEFWLDHSDDRDLFNIPKTYGTLLWRIGKLDESEEVLRTEVERFKENYGAEHPVVCNSLSNFSTTLIANGKIEEAEANLHESLRQGKIFFGDRNPHGSHALGHLATIAARRGDPDGELEYRKEAFASDKRTFPEGSVHRKGPLRGLIEIYFRQAELALKEDNHSRAMDRLTGLVDLIENEPEAKVDPERLKKLQADVASNAPQ